MVKRVFDILAATFLLLLVWPLILTGAIAVKLTTPGPAVYRAKRAGKGNTPFEMFKLRTMYTGSDPPDRRITEPEDGRITPVGAFLRKFKIDELPQFWNVLRGEMSIVGPRPEDWDIVQKYYTDEQRRTLEVHPGVTSLAEINWYPDLTYHDPPPDGVPLQEWYLQRHLKVRLSEELRYLEEQSMFFDLKMIGQTIYLVIVGSRHPPKKRPLVLEHHLGE